MTNQERKGYHGIGATDEAFEYKNTKSDFKCCNYREKWKAVCPLQINDRMITKYTLFQINFKKKLV